MKMLSKEIVKNNLTKEVIQAIKNEKLIKCPNIDHLIWCGDIPSQEMAEKIYDEYLKLKRIKKSSIAITSIPNNLKPIVKNNMQRSIKQKSTTDKYLELLNVIYNRKSINNVELTDILLSFNVSKQVLYSMISLKYVIRTKGKHNNTDWNMSFIPTSDMAEDLLKYNNAYIAKNDSVKSHISNKYDKSVSIAEHADISKKDIKTSDNNIKLDLAKAFYKSGDAEFALKILQEMQ